MQYDGGDVAHGYHMSWAGESLEQFVKALEVRLKDAQNAHQGHSNPAP